MKELMVFLALPILLTGIVAIAADKVEGPKDCES